MTDVKRLLAQIEKGRERLAEAVRDLRKDLARFEARDEAKLIERHRRGDISDKQFEERRRECLTPGALAAGEQEARDQFAETVRGIREDGTAALEQIRGAAPTRKALDPAEAGRVWARLQRRLDAGESPAALARSLADRGDRQAMQTLTEELPDHYEAQVTAGKIDRRLIGPEMKAISTAERPLLDENETAYRETLERGERADGVLGTNAGLVAKDAETSEAIYGATKDQTIHLTEED